MFDLALGTAVLCYCAIWLIVQYVLTVRKNVNSWWAFNLAVCWPATFYLASTDRLDLEKYKDTTDVHSRRRP